MKTFVLGPGYIGRHAAAALSEAGFAVTLAARREMPGSTLIADGAALDEHLAAHEYSQILVTPQLTRQGVDWMLERVDGPRWLILSSTQLDAHTAAPGTDVALARERLVLDRGGTILRPTMVFGRGGDQNVSRALRMLARRRVAVVVGGDQLVQPLHVDDLAGLIVQHARCPTPGLYACGGAEPLPVGELTDLMAALVGQRHVTIRISASQVRLLTRIGRLARLRADQIQRLVEDKTASNTAASQTFGWTPTPLGLRLEQAAEEVTRYAP